MNRPRVKSGLGATNSVAGAIQPFDMTAASSGSVQLVPAATLRCPMIPAVDHWVSMIVQPAARSYLGTPVVEVKVAASYSCRARNGIFGGKLSEHEDAYPSRARRPRHPGRVCERAGQLS